MSLLDLFLDRAIKRGQLTVHRPGKPPRTFGTPDPEMGHVELTFADNEVERQLVTDPGLGAAELFMDGRLQIANDDILPLLQLATANDKYEERRGALKASRGTRALGAIKHRIDRINMERRSKRNVAHHYDLSARLYDLFLDKDRQYSCAYYTDPANDLETAQADKLAHIAAKLAIRPGMRVLDIGCGWGGMALYLHAKTGAEVLGVTLSEEQLKIARERAEAAGVADKVRFELIDYRRVEGRFDRIVSVGMFEHVGPPQYRTFFRKCFDLLADDGVMLLHTIGRYGAPSVTDEFTTKYIFPGGYNPALSEIVKGYEGLPMFLTDVEVLRMHYGWTTRQWYDRAFAAREQIVALYDERFWRMWIFYLAGASMAFLHGGLCNYQVQLARRRDAVPVTRDYMFEGERAMRG
jgi:cyclopropane-fatty-acyl-phospholipid synthase